MGVDLLSVGQTGLSASKKALQTTGHNIANVNTEGYSRQRISQTENMPVGEGSHVLGTGVRINGINRVHDEFLEKRLNNSVAANNYHEERSSQLSQVEDIFNESNTEGLNKILNRFFNSFRELSAQPENDAVRSVVRENAQLVAHDIKRGRESLNEQAKHVDRQLEGAVEDINTLIKTVADLNVKIKEIEVANGETGDLRDQRDLAVSNLSEFFKIHTYTNDSNQFVVQAEGVGTLVTGLHTQPLKALPFPEDQTGNGFPGAREIVFADKPTMILSNKFEGGKIGAMLEARNVDIKKMQDQLDEIAFHLTNSVNAVHSQGFANKKVTVNEFGNPIESGNGPFTGINFFKDLNSVHRAAEYIDLSADVKRDVNNIVTAMAPNAPGDNKISVAISKLQHEPMFKNGTATLEDIYLESIGDIGLKTKKSTIDAEQAKGIVAQTKNLKERISGVSIDEESANLVKYQHAYDASAKVLQTANEMFKTVLGIMR